MRHVSIKLLKSKKAVIVAAIVAAVMMVAIVAVRLLIFDLLVINGHSMSPTIRHGDRVLVNRLAYRYDKPERGDIVAFKVDSGRIFVKRVVGLPGDIIEVRQGVLYRNGKKVVNEPYVRFRPRSLRRRSYKPGTLQNGLLFVMGDNRASSVDSKDFGPIPYRNVIGKAILIYFPPRRMKQLRRISGET
ncbi:signal peptidase I [Candidatus Poribacteria bacterium]